MSFNMVLLYHFSGTIVTNINNSITYNEGSNVILNASLDTSLTKLKLNFRWNYNFVEFDITWRMFVGEYPI
jgi:hypothetical protein